MEANFLLLLFLTCGILYLYPIMGKPSQYKIRIISILLVGFAIYLSYEINRLPPNYYQLFEVSRDVTPMNLRHAFRRMSLKYHPDKNIDTKTTPEYYSMQSAYDILFDEIKRDRYNRFGPDNLQNDPRANEIALIINMIGYYLSWLCGLIIITIPKSSHSSRFWSIIYLLIVIILRCIFTFTDIDITSFRLQSLFPSLTEYELIQYLHLTIPVIFLLFRIIAEYYYIDIETETIKYLMTISHNHRLMIDSLQQISQQISFTKKNYEENNHHLHSSTPSSPLPPNLQLDINKLVDQMTCLEKDSTIVSDQLKKISVASHKSYSWILFIIVYLGFQLLSQGS